MSDTDSELDPMDVCELELEISSDEDMDEYSSSSSEDDDDFVVEDTTWHAVNGDTLKEFEFQRMESVPIPEAATPAEIYNLFVDDDLVSKITKYTNVYAEYLINNGDQHLGGRWKDTYLEEIKKFFGILLYMGIVKLTKISHYWRKDHMYGLSFCRKLFSRQRFQDLLRTIHFNDISNISTSKTLKLDELFETMVLKFQKFYSPEQDLVVDESMVHFRGRLGFRQYSPGKAHKFGVKLFKLTDKQSYTLNVSIYGGANSDLMVEGHYGKSASTVIFLAKPYYGRGYKITTDNYYTSIELAKYLMIKKTHLRGTVRKGRKGLPALKSLKKGEMDAKERNGIVVGKWKDKREINYLSTFETGEMIECENRRHVTMMKPNIIANYNICKKGIDVADQLSSYYSPLRKSVKWYHKVGFDLLLSISVVNSYVIYKKHNSPQIPLEVFTEMLIKSLTQVEKPPPPEPVAAMHYLKPHPTKLRRRCTICYQQNKRAYGTAKARKNTKQVQLYCPGCIKTTFICFDHFEEFHKSSSF